MVEIAIAVAVIAFALVAIIGVLPAGLQVQKENRADTIINREGGYWMEAIRGGAQGIDELTNVVDKIVVNGVTNLWLAGFRNGREIIGLLSTPDAPTNTFAHVRSLNGIAAEYSSEVAFAYRLDVQIRPFQADTKMVAGAVELQLEQKLREVRLLFTWPLLANGTVGNGRQVFRSLISGYIETNTPYFFFTQ